MGSASGKELAWALFCPKKQTQLRHLPNFAILFQDEGLNLVLLLSYLWQGFDSGSGQPHVSHADTVVVGSVVVISVGELMLLPTSKLCDAIPM